MKPSRQIIPAVLSIFTFAVLFGCGESNSKTENPPPTTEEKKEEVVVSDTVKAQYFADQICKCWTSKVDSLAAIGQLEVLDDRLTCPTVSSEVDEFLKNRDPETDHDFLLIVDSLMGETCPETMSKANPPQ